MIKPKKTLLNIEPYRIDKYYKNQEMKLDSNENPYGASPVVINAIKNFDPRHIQFYPAYGELIDCLAELAGAKPENFILTNGCDEAINVVLNTYLDKGDEILSFSPTFSMPVLYSDCIGAKFVEIPYGKNQEFDYELYTSEISDKTKIIYLTSPNNPTGGVISPEVIKKLLSNYKDKLVVLDCTYINFSSIKKEEYYNLVREFDNLAVLKSFSKDYALAGLRLGYIYSNELNIREIKKVISPYSVNAAAVQAGIAALSDIPYYKETSEKISRAKEKLVSGLNSLGFGAFNTEANFILADFGDYSDFVYNKMNLHGVALKRFKKDSPMNGLFRIAAPREEDTEKLLNLLSPRPLFVFDLDGVVFDVRNSYRLAIKKTFEHFTDKICTDSDIQAVKNLHGMSNDWDVTAHLIKNAGFDVNYQDVVNVFQNMFFNPENKGSKGLIDNEELVFKNEFFEKLTKTADCAVFTARPQQEAFYSLEKYGIKKYFSYFICCEDVGKNCKPSPFGLNKIKSSCLYNEIYYFGDTIDDIKAGMGANIKVFGIIPPHAVSVDETKIKLKEAGASGVFENPDLILTELLNGDVKCV